jgi:hypothetical protein
LDEEDDPDFGQELELKQRKPGSAGMDLAVDPDFGQKTAVDVMDRPETGTELNVAGSQEAGIAVPEIKANDDPLRIVLTSLDQNIDAFAREAAHEKLAVQHEGPLWKRMVKSVWGNLSREYQVVKATNEARDEIRENENLLHHQGKSDAKWREAVVGRYGSEYAEHLIHEGETFHNLNTPEAQQDPNAQRIRGDTLDLLRRYAKGEILDEVSLELMQGRMVEGWRDEGISQQFIGEGEFLAHNIGEMAQQVKAALDSVDGLSAIDRDARLEEILANAEIVTGEARVGSRTEIDSTLSERMAEKLRGVPFLSEGRIARVTSVVGNEMFVAAMLSASLGVAQRGFSTATKVIAPGVGAGIVAGVRERNALLRERGLAARRADAGMESDPANKAQAELDLTLYEARSAAEMLGDLGNLYNETGELNIMDRDTLDQALLLQADIRARTEVSDRTGARLISFAGVEGMEGERFDLDLAMAKLEVDMRKLFANPVAQGMLDIRSEETFDVVTAAQREIALGMLTGEMKGKDRLFNKLAVKRVMKVALTTTLMGGAVALGVKEAAEAAVSAYQSVEQFAHELFAPNTSSLDMQPVSYTTDGSVGVGTGGSVGVPETQGSVGVPEEVHGSVGTPEATGGSVGTPETVGANTHQISETAKFNFSENGYQVNTEGGQVSVTTPSGEVISGLELNKDGALSQSALDSLQAHGLNVSDAKESVVGKPEVTHTKVTSTEFVRNHQKEMEKIHITKWFDNNTSRFDLNELGLQNQVNANGSLTVSIQGMTADGSFHGNSGVNWHEAARGGHMRVYLSASEGSQSHAFEVAIGADGKAVIGADSPARALFDDHGKFIGGFEQVALNGGEAEDGTQNIAVLATAVGEHKGTLTDTHETQTILTGHTYTVASTQPLQPTAFTSPTVPYAGPVPVVPLTGRRNLGRANQAAPTPGPTAPVSPIGPATPKQKSPGAEIAPKGTQNRPVAAAAEPKPARNPETERFAKERGLGSSQTAGDTTEGQKAEAQIGSESDAGFTGPNAEQAQGPLLLWDEMHDFLVNAQSETRPFPYELNADRNLNQYSPQAIKIATALAHMADNAQPQPNESPQASAARKAAMIKETARRVRSMVADIPRSDQGHYRMASDILFNIKP